MRVVTLVTQKGGTGKSTLSTCLAVAAMQAGEQVVAFDLDPQGTLAAWGNIRQGEAPAVVTVPAERTGELAAVLKAVSDRFSLAILDTAGVDNDITQSAMKLGDMCLVPLRPTRPDGLAIKPTVEKLMKGGRSFGFVLNQCVTNARSSRAAEMAAGLASLGLLAEPMIHSRADYQDAFSAGQGVTEYAPKGQAAEEIRSLWAWVNRQTKESGE